LGGGQTLQDFMTSVLPAQTGVGVVSGANAVYSNGLPYPIVVDSTGAFFQGLPSGTYIGDGTNAATTTALHNINGGSDQAKVFLLLHELGHMLNLFGPTNLDAGNAANQAANNQAVWNNCQTGLGSLSNY
jgi:hypothetical protein